VIARRPWARSSQTTKSPSAACCSGVNPWIVIDGPSAASALRYPGNTSCARSRFSVSVRTSSGKSVKARTNPSSYQRRSIISRVTPSHSAASVCGRMGIQ
jgi:hypothetical protein